MTQKAKKESLFDRKVAAAVAKLKGEESLDMGVIVGVCEKVKLRHSDVGTGVVLMGSFAIRCRGVEEESTSFCDVLILPLDIGDRIAKKIAKSKNSVRFSIAVSIKKSDSLTVGYKYVLDWKREPEEMGQQDALRELLSESAAPLIVDIS